MQVYMNGEFIPETEASVSIFDHGLLYGDGVFEGIRAYDGFVFKLEEHVDRLFDSAKALRLEIPMTREEMAEIILETLRVNELSTCYIRPIVTRGIGNLGIDPKKCTEGATVFVIVKEWSALYPEEFYQRGLRAIVASTRAKSPQGLSPNIKSLNYLNNIMAKLEANAWGADEAIMLDIQGNVAEGTADNIFVVKNDVIYTPPIISSLDGITRSTVIDVAFDAEYMIVEENFGVTQLYTADEIFLTGTAAEVISVVEVDGRVVGDGKAGPVAQDLRTRFKAVTGTPETGTAIYQQEEIQVGS